MLRCYRTRLLAAMWQACHHSTCIFRAAAHSRGSHAGALAYSRQQEGGARSRMHAAGAGALLTVTCHTAPATSARLHCAAGRGQARSHTATLAAAVHAAECKQRTQARTSCCSAPCPNATPAQPVRRRRRRDPRPGALTHSNPSQGCATAGAHAARACARWQHCCRLCNRSRTLRWSHLIQTTQTSHEPSCTPALRTCQRRGGHCCHCMPHLRSLAPARPQPDGGSTGTSQ